MSEICYLYMQTENGLQGKLYHWKHNWNAVCICNNIDIDILMNKEDTLYFKLKYFHNLLHGRVKGNTVDKPPQTGMVLN